MTHVIVEIFIYVIWAMVFLTRLRKGSRVATEELLVLLTAIPTTIIMEIRNEYIHAAAGVYYPFSLLYFPDFKFPLAIVFSSSLFAWLLFIISYKLAARLLGETSQFHGLLQLGFFLLLISSNAFPEWLGVRLGYWQWYHTPPANFDIWKAKYFFYFLFTFPPFLMAKFFSWRMRSAATVE